MYVKSYFSAYIFIAIILHQNQSRCCINLNNFSQIPHFKDVVIMSTSCDACGHKTNEVKSSSGIEPLGVKITLHIEDAEDLKRDVLKVRLKIFLLCSCCCIIAELNITIERFLNIYSISKQLFLY